MTTKQELKTLLEKQFGMGKVHISSGRSTVTRWITIDIDCPYTPQNLVKVENIVAEWKSKNFQINIRWQGDGH